MNCDHFNKEKINKIYNEKGKVTEYDLACSTCGRVLKHYKYGIAVQKYGNKNIFTRIIKNLVDYFEYRLVMLKRLLKL